MTDGLSVTAGEPITLYGSRKKWLRVGGVSCLFAIAGLLIGIREHSAAAWLALAFSGLCTVVSIWSLIKPPTLVITATSISFTTLWRHAERDLASCSEFEVWGNRSGQRSLVVFDHPSDSQKKMARASRALSGRSTALPDTYGLAADELAALLNRSRARAHQATPR